MLYVIQTRSGEEKNLKLFMESILPNDLQAEFFVPLYESVWRSGGKGHISIQILFPGYVFVRTDQPRELFYLLKKIPKFTRLLNMEGEAGERIFLTVSEQDEAFLGSLIEESVMHVSYIHRDKSGRIDRLLGPLAQYERYITKVDVPHRRAIVEADLFGKHRIIKFGLWTDADPMTPWLRRLRNLEDPHANGQPTDIGIYIGDRVRDKNNVYADLELTVAEIDPARRILWTVTDLFGTRVRIEMDADTVEVVE